MAISKESKELLKANIVQLDNQIDALDKQIAPLAENVATIQAAIAELRRQRAALVAVKQKYKSDAEA